MAALATTELGHNPWDVEGISAFSFFCCPECDFKSKLAPPFFHHAEENHPESKSFCDEHGGKPSFKSEVKFEPNFEEHNETGVLEDDPTDGDFAPFQEEENFFEALDPVEEKPLASKQTRRKRKAPKFDDYKFSMKCEECDASFLTLFDLAEHSNEEHQEDQNLFKCPSCSYSSQGEYSRKCIKEHIKRKHESVKIECPECNRKIRESNLITHMKTSHSGHKDKKFKCSFEACSFESHNAQSVSNHAKYMHPALGDPHPFSCEKCSKKFPYASSLQQHVDKVHLKLKSYYCEKCGKGYNSKVEFSEHQSHPSCSFMTGTDVVFNCDKCSDTFNTVKGYIRHHEVLHGQFPTNLDTGPVHLCDECPKIYLKQRTLELHKKRVHQGTLPKQQTRKTYECPTCEKSFQSMNNMEEHVKVKHENHTPEQCDECSRSFGTPHALKTHKYNMHKRCKCDVCGQSLCNTFWLKRHLSAAHGILPEGSHQCSHCPLFFSSNGAMDNHVKKQHADLFKV